MKILYKTAYIICLILFFSCTTSTPGLRTTRQKLIFSYNSILALPQVSLSCFALAENPHDRILSMHVEHEESGLKWQVANPIFVPANKDTWFGSSALFSPWQFPFPTGKYTLTITDTAQETAKSFFDIAYPDKFLTMPLSEAQETIEFQSLTAESLVVYSEKNDLLYFGPLTSELSTPEGILARYPNAASQTTFRTSSTAAYAVILPRSYLANRAYNE